LRRSLLGLEPQSFEQALAAPYPLISWSERSREGTWSKPWTDAQKRIALRTIPSMDDPRAIVSEALNAARQGAKVLVIRNTVTAAIATAAALESLAGARASELFRVEGQPTLHHSRFSARDRKLLDREVERELGGRRSVGGRVIVGTQTLEQSLDIDADLLMTDLCPVDVLLQRLGRLHRNGLNTRPDGFSDPQAVIIAPSSRDLSHLAKAPRHGLGTSDNGGIYEDLFAVEATWRLIEINPVWTIPEMNRRLVESVTHPDKQAELEAELCGDAAWAEHRKQLIGLGRARRLHSEFTVIPFSQPFAELRFPEDERLATRLGAKDLDVVFPAGITGPFGLALESLRIPHHLLGSADGTEPSDVTPSNGTITFRIGDRAFEYGRLGLRKTV
jgi:CRISPR-associated endonuclease/helicase Cas3